MSTANQASLFEPALLPGLAYRADLISFHEERVLVEALDAIDLAPFQFQGWEGKRQVCSFGWKYDFNQGSFEAAEPMPEMLRSFRARAANLANLDAAELVQALVTRYDPGAGIGWHRDRPVFETVVGVSLLTPATLRFRRRRKGGFDRATLLAEPRSAYVLNGEARHGWEHSIAAMAERRWSVTFRSLSDKGRRLIAAGRA